MISGNCSKTAFLVVCMGVPACMRVCVCVHACVCVYACVHLPPFVLFSGLYDPVLSKEIRDATNVQEMYMYGHNYK